MYTAPETAVPSYRVLAQSPLGGDNLAKTAGPRRIRLIPQKIASENPFGEPKSPKTDFKLLFEDCQLMKKETGFVARPIK